MPRNAPVPLNIYLGSGPDAEELYNQLKAFCVKHKISISKAVTLMIKEALTHD